MLISINTQIDSTSPAHINFTVQNKAEQYSWTCRYLHNRKFLPAEESLSSPAETICNVVGLETLIFGLI